MREAGEKSEEPQATRRPWLGKSSEASGTRRVVRSLYAVERSRLPPQAGAGKRDSFYKAAPARKAVSFPSLVSTNSVVPTVNGEAANPFLPTLSRATKVPMSVSIQWR